MLQPTLYSLWANKSLSKKPEVKLAKKTGQSLLGNASLFFSGKEGNDAQR
jgi:hypothetical protein